MNLSYTFFFRGGSQKITHEPQQEERRSQKEWNLHRWQGLQCAFQGFHIR